MLHSSQEELFDLSTLLQDGLGELFESAKLPALRAVLLTGLF